MNRLFKTGIAIAGTISITGTAMAAKITPDGPSTATGPATLTFGSRSSPSISCTTTIKGTVSGGIAKVTSATFSGPNPYCSMIVAKSLPWTIKADTLTTGHGDGIAIDVGTSIHCTATNNVPGTYNNSTHALSFNNATLNGGCKITGTLTTSNNALMIAN